MRRLLLFFAVCALSLNTWAQNVSGTVTDAKTNDPIEGVAVLVKGTTIGMFTDSEGKYEINVPEGSTTLLFTFVGKKTVEELISGKSTINVSMSADVLELDEVVVTAYGSQRKREITGSVVSINADQVEKVQNSNVIQGLTGKVAGVQIFAQNGQPGASPTVRFRGIGSINASNAPLYVVDGIPFNGNINAIPNQDIESITFLKDASANALYGSRGANGVIIITTKKGKTPGVQVTLDTKIGMNDRGVPEYDIITDPAEYYAAWFDRHRVGLINQGLSDADARAQAAAEIIEGGPFSLGYNNFDLPNDQLIDPATGQVRPNARLLYQDSWEDELFSPSLRTETHLGIRSKTDKLTSFLSFGYLDDEGYALNSGFTRISGRANLEYDVNDWLDVGANMNYANTQQDAPLTGIGSGTYSNLFSWARNSAPIYPVYGRDLNGDFIRDANGGRVFDFGTNNDDIPGVRPYGAFNNPVATSILDVDENIRDNFSARAFARIKFLKDFTFTFNVSADYVGSDLTRFATPEGGDASSVNGRITTISSTALTVAHQQMLNWKKNFGDHTIDVLVGHESNQWNFKYLWGQKTEAVISDLPVLDNASNIQGLVGYERDYNVEGYLSRVNYDFKNKYFVNASFRRDGSSVFHPDNRWGNFFGFGVAWDMSQEAFLSGNGWLNNLRLKASYGQQGNDAILYENSATRNYYAYTDQFNVVDAGAGVPGVSFNSLGNRDLQWETSTNMNFGFEAALLDNRLSVNVEYFIRQVEDLLFYNPLALSEGRGSFPDNVGDMENRGIEVTLEGTIVRTSDFQFGMSLNATHFQNEITALPQEFIDDGQFRLEEGRSRFDLFMREFAGINSENGETLWFMDVLDADGNPTGERMTTENANEATEYFVGKSAIPDLYGGFATNFSYKGISLNVNFAYSIGGYGIDGVYQGLLDSQPDVGRNYHKDIFQSWTPENTSASIPRIDLEDPENSFTSDFFLTDLSYLSLQDIVLSYDLPRDWVSKLGLGQVTVYGTASNVYLWSSRQGFDPRLSTVGTASNEYSIIRSISGGATIQF